MSRRNLTTQALVLKRTSTGEADRVVTLLTRDLGKITAIAKSVRSLKSSKRGALELGSLIKCQLVSSGKPNAWWLLTQATLESDTHAIHSRLPKIRQLWQLLEMVDALVSGEEADDTVYDKVVQIRDLIVVDGPTSGRVKQLFEELIEVLGYQPLKETAYTSITEYVSILADRPLKTWEYLQV